jgi:hypothetical protein
VVLQLVAGPPWQPSAAVWDSRTLQSTPASDPRAGYDGGKRKLGSQGLWRWEPWAICWPSGSPPHISRSEHRWGGWPTSCKTSRGLGRGGVCRSGIHRDQPAQAAAAHGLQREAVELPEAKKGFVLLPCRWVVERSFAWTARFRRLARDYERLPATLRGFHVLVFAI